MKRIAKFPLTPVLAAVCATAASAQPAVNRTVLPVQEPRIPPSTTFDVRNAKMPKRFDVKAPAGAPNVVIVLIDDLGFGATSTFGGPIRTDVLDKLAANGLRYNNFHTTALSSPTRAALKSGRNHHQVNMGFITEMATGFPGATGQIPDTTASLAEILRLNGYSTAAFGKWHETASWEASIAGPFARWPTGQGFEKFYGFIGGETNQWAPYLYDGTAQVELPNDPNYHFMTDMTDKAVAWVQYQKALTPDKPFFVYFAPGATHAPHHVPKVWIDKWKGRFDQGWDKVREETLARQIAAGRRAAGHEARAQAGRHQGLGQAVGRREAPVRAPGGGLRGVRRVHRPRDRPHAARDRRRPAQATTRSSSTSPATTAPAARAAPTACSTSTRTSTACRRRSRTC